MGYEKYRSKINFIKKYRNALNAATGSEVDANANVENKNIATMAGEIPKRDFIGINRLLMHDKISELYGVPLADEYIRQIEDHEIYKHDETSLFPYCVSITMYPFLFGGLQSIGGVSKPPTNLKSFCGSFINLVFAVASQFAGAVATPEFLTYLDYFIRREYGDDYYLHPDEPVEKTYRPSKDKEYTGEWQYRTIDKVITDCFEQVDYSMNIPAAARNFQSVFWNIAYFDKYYFASIFEDFVFPDGTEPKWESVKWLQKRHMEWLNNERSKAILTFPVETVNALNDGKGDYKDKEMADLVAEMWSKGHSFFLYTSDTVDSLSSCCRLRNGITDNTFSYTLGAGGVSTGSKSVMTINVNRLVQNVFRKNKNATKEDISEAVREQVKKIHKYQIAFNEIMKDNYKAHMLPVYEAGYISLEKQYLTIGINGFVEAAEFLGIDISPNDKYFEFGETILKPIYEENQKDKTKEIMFNTEFVPAENLGVKNAKWDKKDGYFVPRDCYNSYFYIVEDESTNIIDKLILHGKALTKYLDGGVALHMNLSEHLSKEQYRYIMNLAVKTGCTYLTFNVPLTACDDCGFISKRYLKKCPKCGSENVDYVTRVIGYLKRVSKFSEARIKEAHKRYFEGEKSVESDLKV